MIERLSRSERWIIAERQRKLSWVLVGVAGVLLCFGIALAQQFSDLAERVGLVCFFIYLFLYVCQLYLIIGLAVNYPVAYSLLWSVVILLAFTPLVQWVTGVVLCVILLRDWRQQGLEVHWYGPTTAALRAMEVRKLCQQCEYDLTGNESGVCPECGSPIATNQSHETEATGLQF